MTERRNLEERRIFVMVFHGYSVIEMGHKMIFAKSA
jgi:hypothetical protein